MIRIILAMIYITFVYSSALLKIFRYVLMTSFPSVAAVDCGPLLPPKNGSSMGKETTFTKTITFKCDAGFDLIGSLLKVMYG